MNRTSSSWPPFQLLRLVVLVLAGGIGLSGGLAPAQEADPEAPPADEPAPMMVIEDDLFEAGSSVDLRAKVQGDLFAAGGWVELAVEVADNLIAAGAVLDAAGRVEGDFIVTGGLLDLIAEVGDNLVAAGGVVDIDGLIGRKLFASAIRLKLGRDALIGGDAWLAAASADVAGTIEGDAVLAGGSVTVRGRIKGDVETTALSLTLTKNAIIGGRLIHRGPEPPDIEDGATVIGGVEHAYEPKPTDEPDADPSAGELPPLLWLLIILVLGLVLDLLVPGYLRGSEGLLIRHPFASFGLGLAILFTTPVVIVILMVSVLGFALGLAALATYGTLLLLGPVVALFAAARLVLGRFRTRPLSPVRRRFGFALMLLGSGLLGWLPYVGTPLLWLISVLGLGAATWQIYESLRRSPANADAPESAVEHAPAAPGER